MPRRQKNARNRVKRKAIKVYRFMKRRGFNERRKNNTKQGSKLGID